MVIEQWQWQILFKLIFKKLCTVNLCPDYRDNNFFGVLGLSRRQGVLYYSGRLISAFVGSGGEVHGVGGFSPSIVIFPQLNFCPSLSLNVYDWADFWELLLFKLLLHISAKLHLTEKDKYQPTSPRPPGGAQGYPLGTLANVKLFGPPFSPGKPGPPWGSAQEGQLWSLSLEWGWGLGYG